LECSSKKWLQYLTQSSRSQFVTGNRNKVEEVKALMADVEGVEFDNVALDLPELQGSDAVEIAREKCMLAAKEVRPQRGRAASEAASNRL
jgi:inosine/xanthosine triphosphate pyrophosphatase family protein